MDAWEALHPGVQQWLWQQGWPSLREVQANAIPLVLGRDRDVLISAPTAGGKTEAAFLPIVSHLASDPSSGVGCLCVSPLRALINDQTRRLTSLTEAVRLRVQPWHGDVSAGRAQFWKAPAAVLIITPESLEAMFVRRPGDLARVLADLRYICVDELHSFVGSVRGRQLQSLLHRVDILIGRKVPRIALSATFGSIELAEQFLRPNRSMPCSSIEGSQGGSDLRMQVRALVRREKGPNPNEAIAVHLFEALRGQSNLVFANRRESVEWFADALREASEKMGVPNEFFPHHGSLSRDQRLWLEERLRDEHLPTTAVCTSTLELGVDLGDVASVAQIGASPTVSSLKQRLGRSGRRPGQSQVLRQFVILPEVEVGSPPSERLRLALIQAIATIELMLDRRYEPPDLFGDMHCSTLVQQIVSVIAQRHGATADYLFRLLCVEGPFARLSVAQFKEVLRGMAAHAVIEQLEDGTLMPGEIGEHLLAGYDIYIAFVVPEAYRLMHNGRPLGTLPMSTPALPGSLIVFGGRRWKIDAVDEASRSLMLIPAPAGRPPKFGGGSVEVSGLVRTKMREVLLSYDVPAYLDAAAQDELAAARREFVDMGLNSKTVYVEQMAAWLAPWASDRALTTLRLALAQNGIEAVLEDAFLKVEFVESERIVESLRRLMQDGLPAVESLTVGVVALPEQKFDEYLPEALLKTSFGVRHLDVAGAELALRTLLA